jgi:DNA-binding GntR family transcriptional regulator
MSLALNSGLHVKPLYQRLADQLDARIKSGWVRVGQQLPAESDLARAYDVSGGTMRKALDTLEERGVVSRIQGQGTFVLDPAVVPFKAELSREQAEALLRVFRRAEEVDGCLTALVQSLNNYTGKLPAAAE